MLYKVLADIVIFIHLLWIFFIIFGAFFGRKNKIVKIAHLSSLAFAIIIQIFNIICPLSYLEWFLNSKHDPTLTYTGSFIAHYMEKLVYLQVSPLLLFSLTVIVCLISLYLYFGKSVCQLIKKNK